MDVRVEVGLGVVLGFIIEYLEFWDWLRLLKEKVWIEKRFRIEGVI